MAGDRLGVIAAVDGIAVFAAACGAHRKAGHRGAGAIVWRGIDDRAAWAALRAVGEGIAIAPRERVADLVATCAAGGEVGHHVPHRSRRRGEDGEPRRAQDVERRTHDRVEPGQGRGIGAQPALETVDVAPQPDLHRVAMVAHVAGESELGGDAPHRGAEATPCTWPRTVMSSPITGPDPRAAHGCCHCRRLRRCRLVPRCRTASRRCRDVADPSGCRPCRRNRVARTTGRRTHRSHRPNSPATREFAVSATSSRASSSATPYGMLRAEALG